MLACSRSLQRRTNDEGGAAAVEFALILVLFLTLLFGMIQYGIFFYSYETGKQAVGSALRQLTVGNCTDPSTDGETLQAYVQSQLSGATTGSSTVAGTLNGVGWTNYPAITDSDTGDVLTVSITYPTLNLHFPFVPFLSDSTLTQSATGRVEDFTSEGCPA